MQEFWQFSPEQITRMESERMSDALLFPETVAASPAAQAEAAAFAQDVTADATA